MSLKCTEMGVPLRVIVFLSCFTLAVFSDTGCIIELECEECMPENMPLVTSHRSVNGTVRAAHGERLVFACHGGKFLQYPLVSMLTAACESGEYRVSTDGALRPLLALGCQESVFEDVLHHVDGCGSPLEGRAYQRREEGGAVRHLASVCFDPDRGVPVTTRVAPVLAPHRHRAAPLSLLGNFNHMFDAKSRADSARLYGDEPRLNRRLRELLKHRRHELADQTLTAVSLLSPLYFEGQDARVTEFVSNKVAVWRSVAHGNLRHVQHDVSAVRHVRDVRVWSGTHGTWQARGTGPVSLRDGGRAPVPRYVWTVVLDARSHRAAALVVLNDPFVAVSEIRDALFCESACSNMSWIPTLRLHDNYETPLYGLTFCCDIHQFAEVVRQLPTEEFAEVPRGRDGLLTHL